MPLSHSGRDGVLRLAPACQNEKSMQRDCTLSRGQDDGPLDSDVMSQTSSCKRLEALRGSASRSEPDGSCELDERHADDLPALLRALQTTLLQLEDHLCRALVAPMYSA